MKYILVNITPNNKVGFGNQMYSLSHAIYYGIQNKINFLFVTKFLNEINSNNFTNISEIIDFPEYNKYLSNYNIQIADFYNFKFKIDSIKYGYNNYLIEITNDLLSLFSQNNFIIPSTFSFNEIQNNLINYYNKLGINLNKSLSKLHIYYTLDGIQNKLCYNLENNYLENDIIINFNNIQEYTFDVFCDNHLYFEIRQNILFKTYFNEKIYDFAKNILNNHKIINCIHLRLENDVITSMAKETNEIPSELKKRMELKYIDKIKQFIKKDDITLILSSEYDNTVISFLKDNNYNYLITPKYSNLRDNSAIYDCHIAQLCNNIYIGVYESSFSYFILFKIKNKIRQYCDITFKNYKL
jgi:hypothetical protein